MKQTYTAVSSKEITHDGETAISEFPRGLSTRRICQTGLAASWICGLACIIAGVELLKQPTVDYSNDDAVELNVIFPNKIVKEIIPLLVNIVITILTECLGMIHSVNQRWALEKRLEFSSNLRLFTACVGKLGLGRFSNFLQAGFLILCYCASSLLFPGFPPTAVCQSTQQTSTVFPVLGVPEARCVDDGTSAFYPVSLLVLGVGLTGLASITTIQMILYHPPTWSTSPMVTAWASVATGHRVRVDHRSLCSVHDSSMPAQAMTPRKVQRNAWSTHAEVRRVLIYLWILVALALIWFVGLEVGVRSVWAKCVNGSWGTCNVWLGSSWSLIPDIAGVTSIAEIDTTGFFALTFIMIMGFQAALTLGLHCAELLVNMSRDEDTWRQVYSAKGLNCDQSSVIAALRSWKTTVLFMLKPLVHWIFGMGMTYYVNIGVFMRPPQILYLSLVLLVLAIFGSYLCLSKPQGEQPATYGHVQTLVNLVDAWNRHVYWGHKGVRADGTCQAGTDRKALGHIRNGRQYY